MLVRTALYGIGDSCFNTFSAVILSAFFLDKTEPAFSCRLVFISCGFVTIFLVGPFLSLFVKMALLAAVLLVGGAMVVFLHLAIASVNVAVTDDDAPSSDTKP